MFRSDEWIWVEKRVALRITSGSQVCWLAGYSHLCNWERIKPKG